MRVFCVFTRDCKKLWCGREDSNLHGIATASPSSWCVCQFRHYRTVGWYHSSYRMLTLQPPSVSKSFLSLPLSALRPKKSTTQVPDQETERYGFFVGAGADGGLVGVCSAGFELAGAEDEAGGVCAGLDVAAGGCGFAGACEAGG